MHTLSTIGKQLARNLKLSEIFHISTNTRYSGFTQTFGHFLIAEFLRENPATLVIAPKQAHLTKVIYDINNFTPPPFRLLPALDIQSPYDSYKNRKALNEIHAIFQNVGSQSPTLFTSIETVLQKCVNPAESIKPLEIEIGREYTIEFLRENFLQRGFVEEEMVTVPGEFSVRGGIFDFFSHKNEDPIRLDFFSDELEDMRAFDIYTQKSKYSLKKTVISDIQFESAENLKLQFIQEVLPDHYKILLLHEHDLNYSAEQISLTSSTERQQTLEQFLQNSQKYIQVHAMPYLPDSEGIQAIPSFSIPPKKGSFAQYLTPFLNKVETLYLCYTTAFEKSLLEKEIAAQNLQDKNIILIKGLISGSFYSIPGKVAILSDIELFNKKTKITTKSEPKESRPLEEFLELNEGDYVVHANHGIAINHGITSLQLMGRFEDFLCLEFAESVKVYVPLMNIGLVQKYIGGAETKPALSKIGNTIWENKKKRARKEVEDIAHELLQIQAQRKSALRIPYRLEATEYQKFVEEFPYEETPDQNTAIQAIIKDMTQNEQYMDRIVCGDVGFGKTEIAMRAAFLAALGNVQVAILAPTTILVEQHFKTFSERFQNFPIIIEKINRFSSTQQVNSIQERLKNGTLDIIIGTHKLLSKDFKIKNLGLLIIDEEQRFGVKQKEKLKSLRSEMDLLTLTATPIPRTLHMSLVGIKDISILATPPSNRLPIDSKVCVYDTDMIAKAIRRELARNGQIFFVHNRIASLPKKLAELKEIVPEASIEICHGQMTEEEIDHTMNRFIQGKVNILLSTTIIESGLDIPNANTIFIDAANMYGLSQLHQMRGRIGRSERQGYAILLVNSTKASTRKAEKRLQAIEEFTDLGAGFNLSVADMEIRGVGNLLGAEQHGAVASIGYDMYCQLLEECIRELRQEDIHTYQEVEIKLNIPSFFPDNYIFNQSEKLKLYRRLHRSTQFTEIDELKEEVEDRFGPLPEEVSNLFLQVKIRILCQALKFESIEIVKGQLKINLKNYNDLALAQILRKLEGISNLSNLKILNVDLPVISMNAIETFILKFMERKTEIEKINKEVYV